ncbi:MAG TPA: ABC transporter ATP-binding protein [Gemmataceae bacterium]|nr:ABC transporter ATP-binding protein [Gemmataceae bacterium]
MTHLKLMKNFLRALRYAWPYRGRLCISLVCAFFAALLWGLTFTGVKPILEILTHQRSLAAVAQIRITELEKRISEIKKEQDPLLKQADEEGARPVSPGRNKVLRDLTSRIAGYDSDLYWLNTELYFYRLGELYATRYLPSDPFQTLVCVILITLAAVIVRCWFEFGQESLVGSVVNLSLFDLRNRLYRKVIHLDVNHFSDDGTPDLMARFTNDMDMLGNGTKTLFGKVVAEPLKAIVCVVLAACISWRLTFMFLILVPAAAVVLTRAGRMMKRATRKLLDRMSNIYKILQETFQGIRIVKGFTREPHERRRFRDATLDYYHKAQWVVNLDAISGPVIEILGIAAIGAALLAGAYLVLREKTELFGVTMTSDKMKPESLLNLYILLASIADPIRKLSSVYTRIQSGCAAADRIFYFMDREPKVRTNSGKPLLARHSEGIEFRDVCFSYEPGRPILTNIHLSIRHGETIAFVGKNGCGKSTLVNLLPRFFDPDHGSILIDGQDIRGVNLRSLRQQVGIVTQDTTLFDDTVANNIAYGNRRAKQESIEEAARRAYAHDFITKLPQGYDTPLGEAASRLSGGQKQRIALARAMLRDPRILILDEFTSQSDPESEALIHKAVREFVRNRTTFIITHRLNTLEIVDRIVMVAGGRITSVGTHQELLVASPDYQRFNEAHVHRLSA